MALRNLVVFGLFCLLAFECGEWSYHFGLCNNVLPGYIAECGPLKAREPPIPAPVARHEGGTIFVTGTTAMISDFVDCGTNWNADGHLCRSGSMTFYNNYFDGH